MFKVLVFRYLEKSLMRADFFFCESGNSLMDVYATMNTANARCLTSFTLSQLLIPRWLYLSTRVVRYVHEFEFDIDARYRKASAILFNRFCLVNPRYIVYRIEKYRNEGRPCNFTRSSDSSKTSLELKEKNSLSKPWTLELFTILHIYTRRSYVRLSKELSKQRAPRYRDLLKYRLLGIKYSKREVHASGTGPRKSAESRVGGRPVFSSRGEACSVIYVLSRKAAATSGVANRLYIRRAEGRSRRESAV